MLWPTCDEPINVWSLYADDSSAVQRLAAEGTAQERTIRTPTLLRGASGTLWACASLIRARGAVVPRATMVDLPFKNIYGLSVDQLQQLDEAEDLMEAHRLTAAETLLLKMLDDDPTCIPVLAVLAHLYGKYLSEFDDAVRYYEKVIELEPDNAWARDERRRYQRYISWE